MAFWAILPRTVLGDTDPRDSSSRLLVQLHIRVTRNNGIRPAVEIYSRNVSREQESDIHVAGEIRNEKMPSRAPPGWQWLPGKSETHAKHIATALLRPVIEKKYTQRLFVRLDEMLRV